MKANNSIVLHPKYKLTYFANANWESTWIETARQLLREEWERYYKPLIDPSFLKETPVSESNMVSLSFMCVKLSVNDFVIGGQ